MILAYFIWLLAAHWFADFVMQTHWQATNKWNNIGALFRHVAAYTGVMAFCTAWMFATLDLSPAVWFIFIVFNGVLHLMTDAITSWYTHRFFAKQDWHNGFVVVGLDQLIHQATLAATLALALGVRL